MGMWFSSRYVDGGGPTNLVAPLQRVRQKASTNKTWEDFLALGAIKGDDERKGENKEMRDLERLGESEIVRKRKRKERFL